MLGKVEKLSLLLTSTEVCDNIRDVFVLARSRARKLSHPCVSCVWKQSGKIVGDR